MLVLPRQVPRLVPVMHALLTLRRVKPVADMRALQTRRGLKPVRVKPVADMRMEPDHVWEMLVVPRHVAQMRAV